MRLGIPAHDLDPDHTPSLIVVPPDQDQEHDQDQEQEDSFVGDGEEVDEERHVLARPEGMFAVGENFDPAKETSQ
jgi:hypothetical protein